MREHGSRALMNVTTNTRNVKMIAPQYQEDFFVGMRTLWKNGLRANFIKATTHGQMIQGYGCCFIKMMYSRDLLSKYKVFKGNL